MSEIEESVRLICGSVECGNIEEFPMDTMRYMPKTEPCSECGSEQWSKYGDS